MKVEIDVPDFPQGYKIEGFKIPNPGQVYLHSEKGHVRWVNAHVKHKNPKLCLKKKEHFHKWAKRMGIEALVPKGWWLAMAKDGRMGAMSEKPLKTTNNWEVSSTGSVKTIELPNDARGRGLPVCDCDWETSPYQPNP